MSGTANTGWIKFINQDALKFINYYGITDPALMDALSTLCQYYQDNGLWTKRIAIWPMVGGTTTTVVGNLKSPGTYDLTLIGSPTVSANGIDWNGSTQYAKTGIVPSTVPLLLNDMGMGYYSRENVGNSSDQEMGGYTNSSTDITRLILRFSSSEAYFEVNSGGIGGSVGLITDTRGWFSNERTASNLFSLYKNGTSISSFTTASNSLTAAELYLGAVNVNGTPVPSTKQCAFGVVGNSLGATLAALEYTGINNFQTTLNRNV